MEFIDHTGHIFSLTDYSSYPNGYEYAENPYVFWISDEYTSQLSISCFYIKPIYLITKENIENISITIENSNNFLLLSPKTIREKLSNIDNDSVDWKKLNLELDFFTEETKFQYRYFYDFNSNKYGIKLTDEENIYEKEEDDNTNKYVKLNKNGDIISKDSEDFIESLVYYKDDVGDFIKEINNNTNLELDKDVINTEYDNYIYEFNLKKYEINDFTETYSKNENLYVKLDNNGNILSKDSNDFYIETLVSTNALNYKLIPFYVVANVAEEGCWLTNILIQINDKYCPITVGGTFVDEQEALIINGKNMGIDLPKDICRAIYNSSFWNETPNMSLWNQKIKEYLLNYMKLKGERGNFQSAIQALKWFGYGNKLNLSSLIQNDNKIVNQYICDNFDLELDVINEFKYFRCSTLMSISLPGVIENENDTNKFDFDADFWGEGKPKLIDMFKENASAKHYDEGDIDFIRPYYDWTFNEIGLKLCALKYYYKKYFLPIHLSIQRASITHQVFANDIKLLSVATNSIYEEPIYIHDYNIDVKFPESKIIFYEDVSNYDNDIIIDKDSWIYDSEIKDYENPDQEYYRINDNCFCVNIDLINKKFNENKDCYFNCILYVYQNDKILVNSRFNIYSKKESYGIKFIIYPPYWNKNFDMNFWLSKNYKIIMFVNNNWYEYKFNLKVPELDIELGKLQYRYNYLTQKQFSSTTENGVPVFNANMFNVDFVEVNNINFVNDLLNHKNINSMLDLYSSNINIPENKYLMNKVYIFNLYEREDNSYKNIDYIASEYSKENKIIKYENFEFGDNDSVNVAELYSYIFDENGDWESTTLEYFKDSEWQEDNILKDNFDIYLMHDFQMWYIILISKETIGNATNSLDIKDRNTWRIGNNDKYLFMTINRSDEKFLINRMDFYKMTNDDRKYKYHFNSKDMIAARLVNLNNISTKLKIGSRWSFVPMTFGTVYERHFESKSNIGLMSCAKDEFKLNKGYYRVQVKYSVDNFVNEYEPRSTKLLIDDNLESICYQDSFIPVKSITKIVPKLRYRLINGETGNTIIDFNDAGLVEDNDFASYGYTVDSITDKLVITIDNVESDSDKYKLKYKSGNSTRNIEVSNENPFTINLNEMSEDKWLDISRLDNRTVFKTTFKVAENDMFKETEFYTAIIDQEYAQVVDEKPYIMLRAKNTGWLQAIAGAATTNPQSVIGATSKNIPIDENRTIVPIYVKMNMDIYFVSIESRKGMNNYLFNFTSYSFTDYFPEKYDYVMQPTNTNIVGNNYEHPALLIEYKDIPYSETDEIIDGISYKVKYIALRQFNENKIPIRNSEHIIKFIECIQR